MKTRGRFATVAAIALILGPLGVCEAAPPEVLFKSEAEDLPTTTSVTAAAAPGASGETMVVLSATDSLIGFEMELEAGTYTLAFSAWAPDASHDALFVSTPGEEVRLPIGVFTEWTTASHSFTVDKDGVHALTIRPDPDELNVSIDQVALIRGTMPTGAHVIDLPEAGEVAVAAVPGGAPGDTGEAEAPAGPVAFSLRDRPQAQHERGIDTQFLATFDESPEADYARGRPGAGIRPEAKLVEGKWGQALDCTEHGVRALYSMDRNLAPRSGTLEFWVRSAPNANLWADGEDHYFAYLWAKARMPDEPRYPARLELFKSGSDNALHLKVHGGPAAVDLALPTADLAADAWHHVAISWDCIDLGAITFWLALDGEGRRVTINAPRRMQPFFALQLANAPWLGHYSRAGESAELGGYIDDLHISDEPLGRREEGDEPLELSEIDADLALEAREAFDEWVGVWEQLQTGGAWGPWTTPIVDAATHTFFNWYMRPTDRCVVDNKYGSSICSVGYDFIDAYAYTGDERCRQIAENSVEFFLRGQDPRGYWYMDYRVSENGRVYGMDNEWARIQDHYQSRPFCYLLYWHRLTSDRRAFAAAQRSADFVLSIENPNGAWAGKYNVETETPWTTGPRGVANGSEYNDFATTDALRMVITMYNLTGDEKYLRGPEGSRGIAGIGQWMFDTQIGEGDVRGWCQQYGPEDKPVWSRNFEAPVISPRVVNRFIHPMGIIMWLATGEQRYMDLLQETYEWYRSVEAPGEDGGWYYQYLPDGRPCTSRDYKTVIIDGDHPDGIALTEYGDPDSTVVLDPDDPEAPKPTRSKLHLSNLERDLQDYREQGPEAFRASFLGSSEFTDEDYLARRKSAIGRAKSLEGAVRNQIERLEEHGQFSDGWRLARIRHGTLYQYVTELHIARGLASREIFREGGRSPWKIGGRQSRRPVAAIDNWFDFRLEEPQG